MWLWLLAACGAPTQGEIDTGAVLVVDTAAPTTCGDGVLDPLEQCDDGLANADLPDACRTTCRLPVCGDWIADQGEGCDDGNTVGGDGCLPGCTVEAGPFESEPNDTPATADAVAGALAGSLATEDVDCVAVPVVEGGWLAANVTTDACAWGVSLVLRDAAGAERVRAWPGEEGCSALGPEEGARYLAAGTYALCVEGMFGAEVPAYRLEWTVGDDSCSIPDLPPAPEEDLDLDGLADTCDDDDDGDGVLNVVDNCPSVRNGPADGTFAPNADGYFGAWLALAPLPGDDGACGPPEPGVVPDLAALSPTLGDDAAGWRWQALVDPNDHQNFNARWSSAPAAREVVLVTYVHSARARPVDLALGPDDGMRGWWNGELVADNDACQGASRDKYAYPVDLEVGWNRLTLRVHDKGGGWGLYARLKEGGEPVTDVSLALDPAGRPIRSQQDTDGDGIGDLCDPEP